MLPEQLLFDNGKETPIPMCSELHNYNTRARLLEIDIGLMIHAQQVSTTRVQQ